VFIPETSLTLPGDSHAFEPSYGWGTDDPASVAQATDVGSSVPCLSRNNCNEHHGKAQGKLSGYERKRAHAIAENVKQFVKTYGLEKVGFLTLTFAEDLDWKEAQKRYHRLRTRLLQELFVDVICVLEFTKRGRPHYHLVTAQAEDIRTGFNFEYYSEVVAWNRRHREGAKPSGSLNRSDALCRLHDSLSSRLSGYGFGRSELVPIKTTAEAVGRYVGGYLKKSLGNRKPEHKGARFVRYSQTFNRAVKGAFSWSGLFSWLWRAKLKTWSAKHHCESMDDVKKAFGPHWAYFHREAILETPLSYYPTSGHMAADLGHCPYEMEGSTDIRFGGPLLSRSDTLFMAKALKTRMAFSALRADIVGSSDSPSSTRGAHVSIEDVIQEGGTGHGKVVGGAASGSTDANLSQLASSLGTDPKAASSCIPDSSNHPPRKYLLSKGKAYPKFQRQPIML